MTTTALATISAQTIEQVLLGGDLAALQPAQRLAYYKSVCDSLGLNPLTKPFDYLRLSGKLILYARKDAAEQLRLKHGISVTDVRTEMTDGVYLVTVTVKDRDGRTDTDLGAVPIMGLKGEALANAMMKALTKAKRRATLSICGLGMLDESEIRSIPDAQPVAVDTTTGEILDQPKPRSAVPFEPPEPKALPAPPPTAKDQADAAFGAFDPGGVKPPMPVTKPHTRADGAVTIRDLQPKTASNGADYWVILYGDGLRVSTWSATIAQRCRAARETQEWVLLTIETRTDKSGRERRNLVEVAPADPAPDPTPDPDQDPIPF